MSKKRGATPIENQKPWIEKHGVTWAIILLLLGMTLGAFVTIEYGSWQMREDDKSTARGLYAELNSPADQIANMAPQYLNGIITIPDVPFYSQSSVFPLIKTKIGAFDKSLINNITQYDLNLHFAEENRLKLVEINKINPNQSISFYQSNLLNNYDLIFKDMVRYVIYCYNQAPIIKKQLHDEYGVS